MCVLTPRPWQNCSNTAPCLCLVITLFITALNLAMYWQTMQMPEEACSGYLCVLYECVNFRTDRKRRIPAFYDRPAYPRNTAYCYSGRANPSPPGGRELLRRRFKKLPFPNLPDCRCVPGSALEQRRAAGGNKTTDHRENRGPEFFSTFQ